MRRILTLDPVARTARVQPGVTNLAISEAAIVFDNSGGQVVVCDFTRHATQRVKRVSVTTGEGSEALAVSELDIQRSTVGID